MRKYSTWHYSVSNRAFIRRNMARITTRCEHWGVLRPLWECKEVRGENKVLLLLIKWYLGKFPIASRDSICSVRRELKERMETGVSRDSCQ